MCSLRVNETSPRQIPVYILTSLANKPPCVLVSLYLRPTQVELTFKMGWTYGQGPGCTENLVGQLVQNHVGGNNELECMKGCGSVVPVADVSYYCMGAKASEGWEQGEKSFTHTFAGQGPYTVA